MTIHDLALAGGLFAVLAFVHFFVDWIFQSHKEAMAKHNNHIIRAKHCLIYTVGFLPVLFLARGSLTSVEWHVILATLFLSHFVEDTYIPVYWWAKYIRKVPEFECVDYVWHLTEGERVFQARVKDEETKAFQAFVATPLGKILMIAIDQIIHLTFLWVPVYCMLN